MLRNQSLEGCIRSSGQVLNEERMQLSQGLAMASQRCMHCQFLVLKFGPCIFKKKSAVRLCKTWQDKLKVENRRFEAIRANHSHVSEKKGFSSDRFARITPIRVANPRSGEVLGNCGDPGIVSRRFSEPKMCHKSFQFADNEIQRGC